MARPVADYLAQIGSGRDPSPALVAPPEPDLAPIWPEEPKEDPQIAIDAAREEGRAAGLEIARSEHVAQLAQAQQRFDSELAAARTAWAHEEGGQLREQLAAAMRGLEEKLAESVSRVLRPLIVATLRQKMIGQLIENIKTIVDSREKAIIEIVGPADLLEILRTELRGAPAVFDYVARDSIDVRVTAEQTSIDTQLKAWIDLIGAEV